MSREPDAGDPHVRFDERGVETGADHQPPAPLLDSTDEEAAARIAAQEPKLAVSTSDAAGSRLVPWQRLAPGHFQASIPLRPGEKMRGAVQVGRHAVPFGPVLAGANAEWQFRREALTELKALSALTSGRERLDLTTSWEAPPQKKFVEIRQWLVAVLLVLVVIEALMTRIEGVSG